MDRALKTELIQVVIEHGLNGTPRKDGFAEFCNCLNASGIALKRGQIMQPDLHPTIAGRGIRWLRDADEGTQEFLGTTDEFETETWRRSPLYHLLKSNEMTLRQRLNESNRPFKFPFFDDLREQGITDYLAVKTAYGEADRLGSVAGILSSWSTDAPEGFRDEDIADIEDLLPTLALTMKTASTFDIANNVIKTYLGGDVGSRILSGEIRRGRLETIRAMLFYCDLQGFTRIADTTPRDELVGLLDDYFECMIETLHEHGGEVLKFLGDGLLAIFKLDDGEDVCRTALDAVESALMRVEKLCERRQEAGQASSRFYLALHFGDVLYGNVGSPDRLDFTVVGPAVNEAARIEAMCRTLDQNPVISSAFAEAAGASRDRLVSLGRYALRGVQQPQELFTLDWSQANGQKSAD